MRTAGETIQAREELMAQSSPATVAMTAHAAIKIPSERRSLYCLPRTDKIWLGKIAITPTDRAEMAR